MATGIVALAAHFEGIAFLPLALTYFNIAICATLCIMNAVRLAISRDRVLCDLSDFERGPGFFTIVAGLAIVGTELVTILHLPGVAFALWIAALALWFCLNYAIFVEATLNEHKPKVEQGINGGWLISVVAAQSVAGLAAQLSGTFSRPGPVLFLALSLWLAGGMLYIWLIALIFYRFTFFPFKPENFLPPFRINMGAMAISALTGTMLVRSAQSAALLAELLPFIKGLALLLGHSDLVDSDAGHIGLPATSDQALQPAVQRTLLERRVSVRDVRCFDV